MNYLLLKVYMDISRHPSKMWSHNKFGHSKLVIGLLYEEDSKSDKKWWQSFTRRDYNDGKLVIQETNKTWQERTIKTRQNINGWVH